VSLSFCVLGSGSRGNSTLLDLGGGRADRYVLIDCGLSPRATRLRLAALGLGVEDLSAILLTHLDTDHFCSTWGRVVERHDITVHLHHRHRRRWAGMGLDARRLDLFRAPFDLGADVTVEPILLAHDSLGTVGYIVEHDRTRLGFATDLGRVPRTLLERFVDLDALAIESNYDPRMQVESGRPYFLKRRIMGGNGHLSNEQSIEAVLEIAERSRLAHVVPLHLSQQCNDPGIIERLYADRAPDLAGRLTISSQHEPTRMLHAECERAGRALPADR